MRANGRFVAPLKNARLGPIDRVDLGRAQAVTETIAPDMLASKRETSRILDELCATTG